VTVNSTALADGSNGGLASNYSLASGQTAAATIAPKALTISGTTVANKAYDGKATATLLGGTLNGLVATETLALAGQSASFADKNVGAGKTVTVTGTRLANGTGLASNYSVSNPTGLVADIARLAAVTWVGGSSGSWFDAANWAGGAVPDLANVATVVIPAGVTVTFNNGTVNLDAIGSSGSLSVLDGSLNVAATVQLASLAQSGGVITSGAIKVGSFSQSGGSLTSSGALTVTDAYRQSDSAASIKVAGKVDLSQASGSALLGNISSAGTLGVTAVDGNISQLAGTTIVSAGGTLSAPKGTVSLAASGNSLGAMTINAGTGAPASADSASEIRQQNAVA
ncbi:YDG domain-containing protein, partial [Massilia sp. DWR3-1-1]|uniref:YDG domain-containing protein n=1 Tax=Massilia sp. DWR3-1-1 TaxID=2804559 RepID=UPI003CF9F9C0